MYKSNTYIKIYKNLRHISKCIDEMHISECINPMYISNTAGEPFMYKMCLKYISECIYKNV